MNICLSSKCSTNQSRITFQSKPHLLSLLHSMYNPIKLNNQNSLNFKEHRESSNKFPHTPKENTSTSSKTRISLTVPSMLILTHPDEENSHLTGRGRRTLLVRVLIPKNLITLKFFIEALDKLPTRQFKSLDKYINK